MSYSPDGCNFGNWDIWIYYKGGIISGNFGWNNGSFDCDGDHISTLFGLPDCLSDCTELVNYEFYKLLFEEEI